MTAPQASWRTRISWSRGNLGLVILGAIAAFFVAEIAARILLPAGQHELRERFLIDTRRDRRPYVGFGDPPYNGPRPAAQKPEGEVRVFVLGGSTVEHGEPAVPEIIESMLRDHGHANVRVYNYGVVGQNSGQELSRLVFDIRPLGPDVVVMYNGVNDILPPAHLDPRPGYPFDFIVFERNPLLVERIGDYPLLALIANGSLLLRTCCSGMYTEALVGLDKLRREVGWRTPAWRSEIARVYVDHVVAAARVSEAVGAQFAWFFQPMVYYKEPVAEAERPFADVYREHAVATRAAILAARQRAVESGELSEHMAVDLSDIFDGFEEAVYWNDSHLLQAAQAHVAAQMLPTLLRMLEVHNSRPQ